MPKGWCIENTGGGKTLWATIYAAEEWSPKHPKGQIYANYHINLPNAHFSANMFLPFNELQECLIIFDDVSSLGTIKRYTKVTANRSRKKQMELIFLGQYDKMIDPQLRAMMDYKVRTFFNKSKDQLKVVIIPKGQKPQTIYYHDVIKYIKETNLYDTNEVVDDPTESDIINEIIKLSKNKRDVEKNLMIYTGNKAERKTLLKRILNQMGIEDDEEEQENNNILKYQIALLVKYFNANQTKIGREFGYSQPKISKISNEIIEKLEVEYSDIIPK